MVRRQLQPKTKKHKKQNQRKKTLTKIITTAERVAQDINEQIFSCTRYNYAGRIIRYYRVDTQEGPNQDTNTQSETRHPNIIISTQTKSQRHTNSQNPGLITINTNPKSTPPKIPNHITT